MASLAGLPSRQADDDGLDRSMYFVALEGVSRYALSEAVKSIIRGGLGHTFFPTPVEFRLTCDQAQRPIDDMHRRVRLTEQQQREREEYARAVGGRTPQAVERQQAAYRQFLAGYENGKQSADEAERAEIRARYGMTDEAVAHIADQPIPSNFKRIA
jgi:hypothetical protein